MEEYDKRKKNPLKKGKKLNISKLGVVPPSETEDSVIMIHLDKVAKAFDKYEGEYIWKELTGSVSKTELNIEDLNLAHHADKTIVVLSPSEHQSPMMDNDFRRRVEEKFHPFIVRFSPHSILLDNKSHILFMPYLSSKAALRGISADRIILVNDNQMSSNTLIGYIHSLSRNKPDIMRWKW